MGKAGGSYLGGSGSWQTQYGCNLRLRVIVVEMERGTMRNTFWR